MWHLALRSLPSLATEPLQAATCRVFSFDQLYRNLSSLCFPVLTSTKGLPEFSIHGLITVEGKLTKMGLEL